MASCVTDDCSNYSTRGMNIERDSLLQLKEDRKIYIRKLSMYGMAAPHITVLKTLQKIYSMEPPSVAEIKSICNDVKPLIQTSTEYEEEQTPLQSTQNTASVTIIIIICI